jgi:hypothetical protein
MLSHLEIIFYLLNAGDQVYFYSHTEPASVITNYLWALQTPQSGPQFQTSIDPSMEEVELSDSWEEIESLSRLLPLCMSGPISLCLMNNRPLLFAGRSTINQKTRLIAGTNYLRLTITDGCGTTQTCRQFTVQGYSPYYSIAPNPTSNFVNFSLQENNPNSMLNAFGSNSSTLLDIITVQLFSVKTGKMVLQQNFSGINENFSLNLQNIRAGLYIVHIIKDNEVIQIATISVN